MASASAAETQQQQQQQQGIDMQRLYTSQLYTPERFLANVDVHLFPGKGVGLRAHQDFRTGDLICAVPPLCVVYGPQGSTPENEVLADAICGQQLTIDQIRWLQLLHAGQQGHRSSREEPQRLALLRELLHQRQPRDAQMQPLDANASGSTRASSTPPTHTNNGCPGPNPSNNDAPTPSPSSAQSSSLAPPSAASNGTQPTIVLTPPDEDQSTSLISAQPSAAAGATVTKNGAGLAAQASLSSAGHAQSFGGGSVQGTGLTVGLGYNGGSVGVLTEEWVMGAIACHTAGDSCEDVAVAHLRQQEPLQSYCGLWPEFALLNHSCSPNTVHIIVGGWLLLRAARPVAEGTELTTCHIGAGRFQHVASRRSQLQRQFGFHCTCGRCTLEHHFFPTVRYPQSDELDAMAAADDFLVTDTIRSRRSPVQSALDLVFGKGRFQTDAARDPQLLMLINRLVLSHLEPELDQAVSATTRLQEKRRTVLSQCQGAAAAIEQSLEDLGLEWPLEAQLRASAFELYRLRAELNELLPDLVGGPEQVAGLRQAVQAVEAVARGTELHVLLAVRLMQKTKALYGGSSTEARESELACISAHQSRYGKVSPELLCRLVRVRLQRAVGSSLAQRMGVLAWDALAAGSDEEGVSP